MTVPWRQRSLLRPSELAAVSGRSLRTIWRKLEAGTIESRVEDGCRLIPIEAALVFLGEKPENAHHPHETGPISARARAFVERIRREAG